MSEMPSFPASFSERNGMRCESAPKWDPRRNPSYGIERIRTFVRWVGSRSAPIGTLPRTNFVKRFQQLAPYSERVRLRCCLTLLAKIAVISHPGMNGELDGDVE